MKLLHISTYYSIKHNTGFSDSYFKLEIFNFHCLTCLIGCFLILISQSSLAQPRVKKARPKYYTSVVLENGLKIKGYLMNVTNTGIELSIEKPQDNLIWDSEKSTWRYSAVFYQGIMSINSESIEQIIFTPNKIFLRSFTTIMLASFITTGTFGSLLVLIASEATYGIIGTIFLGALIGGLSTIVYVSVPALLLSGIITGLSITRFKIKKNQAIFSSNIDYLKTFKTSHKKLNEGKNKRTKF